MNGFGKIKKRFSTKEKFYISLSGKKICNQVYEHGVKIKDRSKIKKMKDYHDMHLKSDVLLLVDVFESFRNSSLKN